MSQLRSVRFLSPALVILAACHGAGEAAGGADPSGDEGGEATNGPATGSLPDPASTLQRADDPERRAVYVPVYSHIYFGDHQNQFDLTVTLSVRNTDPTGSLLVTVVRYLDSDGRLVRDYVEEPFRLGPMASADFVVAERDRTGGIGANFVVEWEADERLTEPVVEAVMIGTRSGQGISFLSVGRPTRPSAPAADSPRRRD